MKVYKIRKMTPREIYRLMGVDDTDIDKLISSDISNSALYKMGGNSIVVDVMTYMFGNLFLTDRRNKRMQ